MSKAGLPWVIAGLIAAGISGFLIHKNIRFLQNSVRSEGRVISILEIVDDEGSSSYAPVYTYTGNDLQVYTNAESIYSSPLRYKVGDPILILYNKEKPAEVKVDRFIYIWLVPMMLGIMALMFLFPLWYSIYVFFRKIFSPQLDQPKQ